MLRRLRPLDRVLLLTLSPLWLVCLTLHIDVGLSGRMGLPHPAVSSAPSPDDYPTVYSEAPPDLAVGDRLVRLEDEDLRGVTALGFYGQG